MGITERIKKYRFEFKHLLALFIILIIFQLILSLVYKASIHSFSEKTEEWYRNYSAARMANVTATSLELLIETLQADENLTASESAKMIQRFDIILSQQLMEKNVEEVCIFVYKGNKLFVLDEGSVLFSLIKQHPDSIPSPLLQHNEAQKYFNRVKENMISSEGIQTLIDSNQKFHVFVPLVPNGEVLGALYMKNNPNFSAITSEFASNYDEMAVIFYSIILLGLFAMYQISSYTVRERDKTQRMLYEERENLIKEKIAHEKEFVFTKRIYHAYHKAEKVVGFIIHDLGQLTVKNIGDTKYRISKYTNFIGRVIYDMKWYDPPLHTIINPMFRTDINEVLRFLVDNLFLRVYQKSTMYKIFLELDDRVPPIAVNEFVIWEIIEPLIQNSISHNPDKQINLIIRTIFSEENRQTKILISDDGRGITDALLENNEHGIKKIFLENSTSSNSDGQHYGYGCFIAYHMAKKLCGWNIEAENRPEGGCVFTLTIQN